MTALADMEELLSSISDKSMINYMREAFECYGAGAYRGCIVMSYLALFDDIRNKLSEIAKINKTANIIWKEVEKRSAEQKVFESYMADKLLKEELLTKAEYNQLELIRVIRNRAAHPSGVNAKAEEARYVYRSVIDDFLSKELLKTTHAVDAVLGRLDKENLFPTRDITEVADIVRAEIHGIHAEANSYLISKLAKCVSDENKVVKKNTEMMLAGLAYIREDLLRVHIKKLVVQECSHDMAYASLIGRIISADGDVLKDLPEGPVLRIRSILESNVKNPPSKAVTSLDHPLRQFVGILSCLGDNFLVQTYSNFTDKVIEEYSFSEGFIKNVSVKETPYLQKKLMKFWIEQGKSSTYDTANSFVRNMRRIDALSHVVLSEKNALELVLAVMKASSFGAWEAQDMERDNFSKVKNIKAMAIKYLEAEPEESEDALRSIYSNMSPIGAVKKALAVE